MRLLVEGSDDRSDSPGAAREIHIHAMVACERGNDGLQDLGFSSMGIGIVCGVGEILIVGVTGMEV